MPTRSINSEVQWGATAQTPEVTFKSASTFHVTRLICTLFRQHLDFYTPEHDLLSKPHEYSLALLKQRSPLIFETAGINERQPPSVLVASQALYFALSSWRSGKPNGA
jgi:hypothetical protein